MVLNGISCLLEARKEFRVVGTARNGLEAIQKTRDLKPDVILMDLRMPEMDGVEAMRQIRTEDPDVKFIALTAYEDDVHVREALKAGATGYLLKHASRDELFQAVRTVHKGELHIYPSVATKVLSHLGIPSRGAVRPGTLSERELEVLHLMVTGATNKEIAASLSIGEGTVRTYVAKLCEKLGARGRTEAVIKAAQKGLITL